MRAEFLENSDNVKLALQAVRAMAERYNSHPALLGFEVLNEPCFAYSQSNHSQLVEYYTNAYRIIRSYSPDSIVVFNELYDFFYPWWDWELREKDGFYNIILDVHLYDWQQPFTKEPAAQHVTDAMHWKGVIDTLSKSHPVVVGEWCMSTGTWRQAGQSFVNAAVKSFDRAAGWYMWTWKIQRGIGFDEWDVQYQHMIHGLDPLQVYTVYDYAPSMDSLRP
jgi:aryl-phospho-beta-D-glucosidase BglC (GH1 family)